MKMDIERQVYGLPEELSCKSFLRRLILEWSFLIFPREFGGSCGTKVGEELAGELISKMVGLRAQLDEYFRRIACRPGPQG